MVNAMDVVLEQLELLLDSGLVSMLLTNIPSSLIEVAIYIFTALSLYTIAQRRGIKNPWLAWIPVVNVWVLGCISDQYQNVTNGKNHHRGRTLMLLNILLAVLNLMLVIAALFAMGELFLIVLAGMTGAEDMTNELLLHMGEFLPAFAILALVAIPVLVVTILYLVFYFMSLYDVYRSCDPSNATLFTALSIFFSIVTPIFLFLCRDKDSGMPAQRPATAEPWEQ